MICGFRRPFLTPSRFRHFGVRDHRGPPERQSSNHSDRSDKAFFQTSNCHVIVGIRGRQANKEQLILVAHRTDSSLCRPPSLQQFMSTLQHLTHLFFYKHWSQIGPKTPEIS
ncbi:hypothetical protein T12_13432 [Trichinella patagoniensis]|uniref:Uncharacterized protein n=1 Tax=Trichinella patagoniensis TaxID=990121 RepID=A0A0V1A5F2_9BILA|nr:hypothetical protein T12_13432 [Trichinella patagoniensis]